MIFQTGWKSGGTFNQDISPCKVKFPVPVLGREIQILVAIFKKMNQKVVIMCEQMQHMLE